MAKLAYLTIYALAAAIALDFVAYCFFGSSLAYCPAEGSCDGWLIARLTACFTLAVVGGILQTNYELHR